ncbi:unnamed protein product [Durusdinium trenchii]|uniref:Uncharacterized protein n=1 Tax=Durusdinium trenchii TaxID=1381693 RepID=A0ABP0HZZ4_9DINO
MAWFSWCLAAIAVAQDCQVPPSPNMGYPPCLEGLTVPDGGICTPQCVSGFTPHENQMLCTDGNLSLGGTITCVPDCIAPAEISDAADIPCAEGMSLPHGGRCTPVCSNGSLPVDSSPLLCHNGQLFPSSFTCRLFRCAQPAGLFTDTYHPETPFEALKGAVTLWSETFPSALDYPAEEHCSSASSGGTGCSTCYSPLMTVEVSPDIATIDALSAVVVAFEAIQGRRLALAFEEIAATWTFEGGLSVLEEFSTFPEDFVFLEGEVTSEETRLPAGTRLRSPFVNTWGHLDSGPDPDSASAAHSVYSAVQIVPRLVRPGQALGLALRMVFKYTIPGCTIGREGLPGVTMSLSLQSLVFNLTACAAIGDLSSCSVACAEHASGDATAVCAAEGGTFAFEGCRAHCLALPRYHPSTHPDGVVQAAEVSCAEGTSILHGATCSPVCEEELMSDVPSLRCNDSAFEPARFSCIPTCAPPEGGPYAGSPPCEELLTQQLLRECHARCQPGYRPRWAEPEASNGPVSPLELVLNCSLSGTWSPSNFECQPLWLEISEVSADWAHRWATFHTGDGDGTRVFLRVSAEVEKRKVKEMEAFLLEWQGSEFQSLGLRSIGWNASVEALEALPYWSHSSLYLVTTRLRGDAPAAPGASSCAPLLRLSWTSAELLSEEVQRLPFAELPGPLQVLATPWNQVIMLVPGMPGQGAAGPPCNDTEANSSEILELPAMYFWNGMRFEESQRLEHGATLLEVFVWREQVMVLAVGGDVSSLYAMNRTQSELWLLLNVSLGGISALVWLGCQDDLGFLDVSGQSCSQLSSASCSAEDIRRACGRSCGCPHDFPFLAVAFRSPPSLSILELSDDPPQLMPVTGRTAQPIRSITVTFAWAISEQFLVTTPFSLEEDALIFTWRPVLRQLTYVQTLRPARTGAWAVSSSNVSLLLSAGRDSGVADSRLYAVDATFDWYAGPWGECNGTCRGKDFVFRHREVACRSMPSGLWHRGAGCLGTAPMTEERCQNLEPCPKDSFTWSVGPWSACEGLCGKGLRRRSLSCLRQLVAANGSALGDPREALESECPTPPSAQLECPLKACGSFRLRNRVALQSAWHVVEVAFFVDIACKQQVHGWAVASGRCAGCACQNATQHVVPCGPELAIDGYWDPTRLQASQWISQCVSGTPACAPGEAWIGLQVQATSEVRCVHLLQSADPAYMAREARACVNAGGVQRGGRSESRGSTVALEVIDEERGVWEVLAEHLRRRARYANLQGAVILNDGNYSWDVLSVPQVPRLWADAIKQDLEVSLFQDLQCQSEVPLRSASQYLSMDGSTSQRAFDGQLDSTWIGNAALDEGTGPWLGVVLQHPVDVACVKVLQGEGRFGAEEIALELWVGNWSYELDWKDDNASNESNKSNETGIDEATLPHENSSENRSEGQWWRVRTWPDLSKRSRPALLQLTCDVGLPAAIHVLHDCGNNKQPWQQCMAWCEPGFSGPETSFLCLEDYSFRGITPACVPNECRLGIPTKVGLIIADGCAQLRTGETCTAFCGQGLSGEPLEYECSADGYLRESKSGQVGVVPSCASSFTPVEALGRAGRTASVGLKFTVAWLAQWLALLVT